MLCVLWIWTLVYFCVGSEALRRLRRARLAAPNKALAPHSWVVLRPLYGSGYPREPQQLVPLTQAPLRFVYLAAEHDAEGRRSAGQAVAALRCMGHNAALQVTRAVLGPNGKAAQLGQVPHEVLDDAFVLTLDDDIDASTVNLDAAAAALQTDEQLAAVWLPFVAQKPPVSWADSIAQGVLDSGPHAFVLLAALAPHNVTGKILAYRPRQVAAVGGWGPRVRVYGDDLDLGQALLAAGYRVGALPAHPAHMTREGQSWASVWQRQRRWARIIIDQQPKLAPSYLWYMGAAPLLLVGWLIALWGTALGGWCLLGMGAVLAMRARMLKHRRGPLGLQRIKLLAVGLCADIFLLCAFGAALVSPQVTWLGQTGRIQSKA